MVRYAEGPTTEVSIEIDAGPAEVWALVSDPTLPANFSSELQQAVWNPDGPPPGLDAEIIGRMVLDGVGRWSTTSYVVIWEAEREFSWVVADRDAPAAQWWFLIDSAGSRGPCTLTQRVRLGPGPSGLLPIIEQQPDKEEAIIDFRLGYHRDNMAANLQGYKDLAEGTKSLEELVAQAAAEPSP